MQLRATCTHWVRVSRLPEGPGLALAPRHPGTGPRIHAVLVARQAMTFRLGWSGGLKNSFFTPLFAELIDDPRVEIVR